MSAGSVRRPERLGVFGGTFDPPHIGHLALATSAREALGLERVLFVPAGDPPHKRGRSTSAVEHRHPGFVVSTLEARRPGRSFTVETLRALRRRHPRAELWLLMGEDSWRGFGRWRAPAEILSLARVAVAGRAAPGRGAPGRAAARGRRSRSATASRGVVRLPGPMLDVSSRELRARARRGESLRVLVPDAVLRYVGRHRLYRRRS